MAEIEFFFKRKQLYIYLNCLFLAWREKFFFFFFFHLFSNMGMKLLLFMLACNPKWTQLLPQDGLQLPYQSHPSKPYLGPPNHPFLNMGSPWNSQLFLCFFFFLNSRSFIVNTRAPIYDLWDLIIHNLHNVNDYCNWE